MCFLLFFENLCCEYHNLGFRGYIREILTIIFIWEKKNNLIDAMVMY